jgi:hypothetical protein
MARRDAIAATTSAIKLLLERRHAAERSRAPGTAKIEVAVCTSADLADEDEPNGQALWVWLHRVTPCPQRRSLPSPPASDGRPCRPAVAVDLHYLVLPVAGDALVAQQLLGWAMRALDDQPELPAPLLNAGGFAGCFGDGETVELVLEPLTGTEENEIWQVAPAQRRAAASYVARMVRLDSDVAVDDGRIVTERELAYTGAVP